jgi:hypothetical protein
MILHAASIAAFFADQIAQAPVVVQCVQAAPEPMLKWLLPTIVQTVISLASISAGVLIAVWSFRKNRQTEHEQWVRNQKAEHEQWVRDQKITEWGALMRSLTDAYRYFSHYSEGGKIQRLLDNEKVILRILDEVSMPFVFIAETLTDIGYFPLVKHLQDRVEKCCIDIRNHQDAYKAKPELSQECPLENRMEFAFYPLEKEFFDLLVGIRKIVEEDLHVCPRGNEDSVQSECPIITKESTNGSQDQSSVR